MSKYQQFIFSDYRLDDQKKQLTLSYKLDDQLSFDELYRFDFPWSNDLDHSVLDRALQFLFFMAGVSYYKTYLPPQIVIQRGQLDKIGADFFSKTYRKGLGEFFYINNLDPNTPINFPTTASKLKPISPPDDKGLLIGVGGGKDSLVSVELLRSQPRVATWSVGHRSQLDPLISKIGLPHFWVERTWDRQLLELNGKDAYNGHIPISAIFACVGVIVAILAGYRDVVVSNESSASEPNLVYKNVPINHQYSKSLEFERDFQNFLKNNFEDSIRYYSFLRPLTELRISELFAKVGFDKYKDVFTSCNRAFVHTSDSIFWCGECPKCAFTFLALTPFITREKLEAFWNGKNLLFDSLLEPTYRQLLGIEGDKPLECVGEVKESRAAMRLAQEIYPELKKYQFDLLTDYNFRALSPHTMPEEIAKFLFSVVQRV